MPDFRAGHSGLNGIERMKELLPRWPIRKANEPEGDEWRHEGQHNSRRRLPSIRLIQSKREKRNDRRDHQTTESAPDREGRVGIKERQNGSEEEGRREEPDAIGRRRLGCRSGAARVEREVRAQSPETNHESCILTYTLGGFTEKSDSVALISS